MWTTLITTVKLFILIENGLELAWNFKTFNGQTLNIYPTYLTSHKNAVSENVGTYVYVTYIAHEKS